MKGHPRPRWLVFKATGTTPSCSPSFTPGGHSRTLLGPAHGGPSCFIELVINRSPGWERYFRAVEPLMREVGARPHIGKWVESFGPDEFAQLHGERYTRFLKLQATHEPDGRFVNDFTARIIGTPALA
ncbi:MAG: hypothetical protein ACI8RZ_006336 [Myxococcota bacterium]|jgi:hypothetical protein